MIFKRYSKARSFPDRTPIPNPSFQIPVSKFLFSMSLTTEHELSPELRELEQQLRGLVPCALSQDLFDHVEQSMNVAANETWVVSDDLDELEIHLEQIAPATMPEDMLGRMVRAMDLWHEHVPVEEKVVPFSESRGESRGEREEAAPSRKQYGGGMIAAAAAVAMLGAVTALVLPRFMNDSGANTPPVISTHIPDVDSDNTVMVDAAPRDAWLLPDSLSHKVTNTSDHGVVMTSDNTPHRVIRVDYVDRIMMQDDEGREIEIKRPGIDYMLLPVETN